MLAKHTSGPRNPMGGLSAWFGIVLTVRHSAGFPKTWLWGSQKNQVGEENPFVFHELQALSRMGSLSDWLQLPSKKKATLEEIVLSGDSCRCLSGPLAHSLGKTNESESFTKKANNTIGAWWHSSKDPSSSLQILPWFALDVWFFQVKSHCSRPVRES